ncbi:dynein axonemal intermediate chain 3-like [Onthophagus taurus]|uniref:dynein axonemal intermediate chain 3-like n=1 Tax=Onthophagus taurus TaxID=166361 RepID=UPI0039BDC415
MSSTDNKTEQSQDPKKKKSKKQKPSSAKHHHHHRRRPREETLESLKRFKFDMPGVHRVVLSEKTQADIGMLVGEDVTSELPWKIIQKEVIADHIELIEDSEFMEFRLEVIPYESPEVLMGYIPDEIREYDEFYLVLSKNAQEIITNVITKIKAFQEAKLTRALEVVPKGFWPSFGSEDEIAEYTETPNRNLYEVEVETTYPIISRKVKFRIRPVEKARDGYMELLTRVPIQNVIKSRIDAIVQRSPNVITREAQTNCPYPKNAWTQYFYEFEPVTNLTAKFTQNIRDFVDYELDDLCDKINVNDHINLYSNDYRDLVTDQAFAETPERVSWDEYMSFADLKDARNKIKFSKFFFVLFYMLHAL